MQQKYTNPTGLNLNTYIIKGCNYYKLQKDNFFLFNSHNQPLEKSKGVRQFKKNTCSSIMFDIISKSNIKNVRFSTFTAPEGTPDNVFLDAKELFIKDLQRLKLLKLWCFGIEWQENKTIHTHSILDLASPAQFKIITGKKSYVFLNELWSKKLKFQLKKYNKLNPSNKVEFDKNIIFHCKHLMLGKGDTFINELGKVETKDGKKVNLECFIDNMVNYISKYMQKNASKGVDFTRKLFRYSTGLKINKYFISSKELNKLDLVYSYSYIDKATGEIKEKRRLRYSTKNVDILKHVSSLQLTRNTLSKLNSKIQSKQQSELQPLEAPQKKSSTFTPLQLNFEPQNEINTQYT